MGTSRKRLGRRDAERLLSGSAGDTDWPELTRVLRAASGPAHADELADEPATLTRFGREYRPGRVADAAPHRPPRGVRRSTLAFRTAVALAALLCAGFATGAATGTLPAALQQHAHRLFGAPGVPATATSVSPRGGGASGAAPSLGSPGAASPPMTGSPFSNRVAGWCRAYQEDRQSPAARDFADLASAAGGTEKIPAFCVAVLGAASRNPGTPPPTRDSRPAKPDKTHGPASSKASVR